MFGLGLPNHERDPERLPIGKVQCLSDSLSSQRAFYMDGAFTAAGIVGGPGTAFEVETENVKHDPLELTERVLI